MTALSEAFGVGCALLYATSWLACQLGRRSVIHTPIDFDYLLNTTAPTPLPGAASTVVPVRAPNSKRQPDYLLVAEDPQGDVQLLIVECKGTSKTKSTAIGQLASAMRQVAAIVFTQSGSGSIAVDRHAYAACISKTGSPIKLFGVDPPEKGSKWFQPTKLPVADSFTVSRKKGHYLLPPPEDVAGRALALLPSRALAWAGASDQREDYLQTVVETDIGDFTGTRSTVQLPDGHSISVFTGAERSVIEQAREALESGDKLSVWKNAEGSRGDTDSKFVPLRTNDDPERVASGVTEDGMVLEISID